MALRKPIQMITNVNMGGYIKKVEYLVIHFVGAAGQAINNGNFFKSVNRRSSAHYFVDPKHTVQVVPENRAAWHVGDGKGRYGITNSNSIGIEGCQDTSTGKNVWYWDFHPDTYQQMIELTSHLQKKYGIPDSKVVRHYDASRKLCPGNWQHNNWAKWHQFKRDLAAFNGSGQPSKVKNEKAIFTLARNIEARVKPDGKAKVIRDVKKGESIQYHAVYVGDGHRWLEYKEGGQTAYLPYRALKDTTARGTFKAIPDLPKEKQLQDYVGNNGSWKALKVGDNVTIRPGSSRWLHHNFKQMSPMTGNYAGRKDKVAKVKNIKIGYSDRAYYLEKMKVWVLEQDIEEAREKSVPELKIIHKVQVGAFGNKDNAENLLTDLRGEGYTDAFIKTEKK